MKLLAKFDIFDQGKNFSCLKCNAGLKTSFCWSWQYGLTCNQCEILYIQYRRDENGAEGATDTSVEAFGDDTCIWGMKKNIVANRPLENVDL